MTKVSLQNATKIYKRGKEQVHALNNCNLELANGDYIAIMGPSGSGKSTLLKAIATSISLSSGSVLIDGQDVAELNDVEKSRLRSESIGYIVQDFMLLENETVFKNIRLPLIYNKNIASSEYKSRVEKAAKLLGIEELLPENAKNLSGGEKQRVAIARAICGDQDIILADEPTGALDSDNRSNIMQIFEQLNQELKKTIIVVTHDEYVAEQSQKIYHMKDGVISSGLINI